MPESGSKGGKPPSLGDVARLAGFSRMTVSYALRNHPKISDATRKAIREVANRIGYYPDARIAQLTAQVRNAKRRDLLPIAWLNTGREEDLWHRYAWLNPYFEGARLRCFERGYKLDEFWVHEPRMTSRKLSSILMNRGITGVILAPPRETPLAHINLEWKRIAAVTFEGAFLSPRIHRIIPDYYFNLLLALKRMRRLGYRRIGVLLDVYHDRRASHFCHAAIAHFHSHIAERERVAPLFYSSPFADPSKVKEPFLWLKKVRPDAILGQHSLLLEWLAGLGYAVPGDIGVAHLATDSDCEGWAGISQRKQDIGAEAAELCISMVQNSRLGIPAVPYDIVVPGMWKDGPTLTKQIPSREMLSASGTSPKAKRRG